MHMIVFLDQTDTLSADRRANGSWTGVRVASCQSVRYVSLLYMVFVCVLVVCCFALLTSLLLGCVVCFCVDCCSIEVCTFPVFTNCAFVVFVITRSRCG